MNTAKHTPGPWTFSREELFGEARFYVAQADGAPYTPQYSDVSTLIAETVSGERVRIQEANAMLIAAAPELLEALKLLIAEKAPVYHDCTDNGESECAWCHARAAIAKAGGAESSDAQAAQGGEAGSSGSHGA